MSMAYFSYTFVENQNRQNNGNEFSAINALQDFAVSMNFTTKSTELFGVHCIMDEFKCLYWWAVASCFDTFKTTNTRHFLMFLA